MAGEELLLLCVMLLVAAAVVCDVAGCCSQLTTAVSLLLAACGEACENPKLMEAFERPRQSFKARLNANPDALGRRLRRAAR